jgi:hypothetical protein
MNWELGYWILFSCCLVDISCVVVIFLYFRRQWRLVDHMLDKWQPKPEYIFELLREREPR